MKRKRCTEPHTVLALSTPRGPAEPVGQHSRRLPGRAAASVPAPFQVTFLEYTIS